MTNNILVIGGTGKTGRKVAQGLRQQGQYVRIGSRQESPAFDWQKPQGWPTALANMDKVYISYYPDLAVPGAYEAIQQLTKVAKEVGVKKLVLLSGKGEVEAERCEQVVANSGLDFTLVRASWFNQNFTESFLLQPVLAGYVALPMAEAKIPFVDTTDIAEVAIQALLDDRYHGKTLTVTGPTALTFAEAINTIAQASGRNIQFQPVSLDEYHGMLQSAGLPADYVWLIDYLFREVLGNPANQAISQDVEQVLGRKAISFQDFARENASTGVWNQSVAQTL